MREKLNEQELDMIVGGAVAISLEDCTVAFTTVGKKYSLQNVTPQEARNVANDLLDEHPEMGPQEFDIFVAREFNARGWLVLG